jgi:hypothetical protein
MTHPAGRKVDLSAKTARAIVVRHRIGLWLSSTKAGKVDRFCRETAGEISLEWIASQHAKFLWKCFEGFGCGCWSTLFCSLLSENDHTNAFGGNAYGSRLSCLH